MITLTLKQHVDKTLKFAINPLVETKTLLSLLGVKRSNEKITSQNTIIELFDSKHTLTLFGATKPKMNEIYSFDVTQLATKYVFSLDVLPNTYVITGRPV